MEFILRTEYIELDNVLKALKLVGSGGEARQHIQGGAVKVNGERETRVRRKLRAGDRVDFGAIEIKVELPENG